MELPPLIHRELHVTLRRRHLLRNRLMAAGAGVFLALLCTFVGVAKSEPEAGQYLFRALFKLACIGSVVYTLSIAADLFTSERRNNTLGLLFLSGLSVPEIFFSKLGFAVLIGLSLQLATLPFFALSALFGGVPPGLFVPAIILFFNLLLFSVAIALLASLLTTDDGMAVGLAVALTATVCLIPLGMYAGQHLFGGSQSSELWLVCSPVYGAFLVYKFTALANLRAFAVNTGITFGYTFLALTAASVVLHRVWKQEVALAPRGFVRKQMEGLLRIASRRQRFRLRWLDRNPFVWWATSDRRPVRLGWAVFAGICGLWLVCLAAWKTAWLGVVNSLATMILLNGLMGWVLAYAAGKRIGEDRRNGGLELLLTTPLSVRDIVLGQRKAVLDQFRPLLIAVGFANASLAVIGFLARDWVWESAIVYLLVICAIFLFAWLAYAPIIGSTMWIALNSGRPAYAAFRAYNPIGYVFFVWLMLNTRGAGSWLAGFPYGSVGELSISAVAVILLLTVAASFRNLGSKQNQLVEEFRQIAAEPVPEPSDPRFKKWDPEQRFPRPRM